MINILACKIMNGNVPTYHCMWELGFKRQIKHGKQSLDNTTAFNCHYRMNSVCEGVVHRIK